MAYLRIHKNDSQQVRNTKKRFNNSNKRKTKKKGKLKLSLSDEMLYHQSSRRFAYEIEDFCRKNNLYRWKKTNHIIKLDQDFCFFNNPQRVLKSLLEMLLDAKHSKSSASLLYKDYASFGALYFIDAICWEIAKTGKWHIHSNLSKKDAVMFSKLRSIVSSKYENEEAYMINDRVYLNRTNDLMSTQQYRVRSKEVTDMVEQAIREKNDAHYKLSFDARKAITSTIGEHFDNILQHVPEALYGNLCGYYDKDSGEISILIYNFGKTIADTLTRDTLPVEMNRQITEIITTLVKRTNIFQESLFTMENAITLLSLQEGISSRIKYDLSRGNGFIDFIENCFKVSENARISFISGHTAIKIDNKYKVNIQEVLGRKRRILAFNEENNIFAKPDETYVRSMDIYFPGLIIETVIPLLQ